MLAHQNEIAAVAAGKRAEKMKERLGRRLDLRLFSQAGAQTISGDTASDAGKQTGDNAPDAGERSERFRALIRGEFKDLYDSEVQRIVKQRLKGSEETAKRLEALAPALSLLEKHWGLESGDTEGLNRAVRETFDGESVKLRQLRAREGAERQYARWIQQAGELAAEYPDFELRRELKEPRFAALLRGGAELRDAYELVHRDSIMAKSARDMEERIVGRIAAGQLRPREGGLSGQSAAALKGDVARMSRKTRQEIIRRVQRGEKISF